MKYLGSKQLETPRLNLHKTEEKDLKELWNILLLEEVSKYYLTTKINDDWEKEKIWQYKKLEKASNQDVFTWTIEKKEDNTIIGQISIQETEEENTKDIGWFLDPTYQKKGFAYEAASEVLKYMFLEVEIDCIKTCAAIKNPDSWKLMEKLGFKREKGIKKVKYTFLEQEEECYPYILEKNDFLKEYFRKEKLYITLDIDKDPYIKHLTDDPVLNLTGESGSGKTTATIPYKENPNCIVIDTDNVFSKKEKNKEEQELYNYLIKKYKELPNLYENFDEIYQDILDYFQNSGKMLIVDSAQFRNLKNISLLKGEVIVIRTCINNCYDRCIKRYEEKNKDASFEEIAEYANRKKNMYQWYHHLNSFLDKLDKEGETK